MKIIFEWWKQYFTDERNEWVKYCFQREKIILISSSNRAIFFLLYGQKSEQANREHRNLAGKHTCYIFFYIFTGENMENTSVLVYGKTPITIQYKVDSLVQAPCFIIIKHISVDDHKSAGWNNKDQYLWSISFCDQYLFVMNIPSSH